MNLPAPLRRAIDDWLARGCRVEIGSDGTIRIIPPKAGDDLDLIDFGRKK